MLRPILTILLLLFECVVCVYFNHALINVKEQQNAINFCSLKQQDIQTTLQ